jgi:hypothetical protein
MSKPAYTPGPWRVFAAFTDLEIVTDRPAAHETESIVQFMGQHNAKANASLMAAAPIMHDKLLDAKRHLENARSEVDQGVNDPLEVSVLLTLAFEAVDAALATAEIQP